MRGLLAVAVLCALLGQAAVGAVSPQEPAQVVDPVWRIIQDIIECLFNPQTCGLPPELYGL